MLLSRTASPSLAVIAVTVKIRIDWMTMIDLGNGEEVVWGRFWEHWTTNSYSAPQKTPLNICRFAIGHCEVNRGQWPQVTLDDLETYVIQGQGSQLSHVDTVVVSISCSILVRVSVCLKSISSCVYIAKFPVNLPSKSAKLRLSN